MFDTFNHLWQWENVYVACLEMYTIAHTVISFMIQEVLLRSRTQLNLKATHKYTIFINRNVHILKHNTKIICPITHKMYHIIKYALHCRHIRHDRVLNHHPHNCLPNRLFRRRSKKISKLRVTGLCAGNSPVTSEFPAQRASNVENFSISWRHHELGKLKPPLSLLHKI